MASRLSEAVSDLVGGVAAQLDGLAGKRGRYRREATIEAAELVGALLDSDGRLTDTELDGYLDAVGPLLDPPLITTATQLRETGLLTGKAAWLRTPSTLFDLLVSADGRDGGTRSHVYYELAQRLAHVTAALDLVPSPAEIAAIDQFRSMMLQAMDAASVRRPGQPPPAIPEPTTPAPSTGTETPAPPAPPAAPAQPARPLEELLAELDELIGLGNVKAEVRRMTSMLQVQQLRAERGLPVIETSHHLVFTGNPGTGKTTVARLLSQIYRAVGVVSTGQLVETDRSKLVAGYVGQTALKTKEALDAALGGMLLIDEAYALARGGDNDFGREAIDTLVKFMEDHRDDVAIVAAGYTEEMADFIDANPGLKSRFTRTVHFPDYTDDELVAIFSRLCHRHGYHVTEAAEDAVRHLIAVEPRNRGFGNARFVRNLFESSISHQAMRVAPLTDPSTEELSTLVAGDIASVDG
jgi:Holliday junction resolvasome RuvABC ATP-dependent DNA helicase subunit